MSFLYGRLMVFVSMEKFSKFIKIGYHISHIQACASCWKWSSSSHTHSFLCMQAGYEVLVCDFHVPPLTGPESVV
jgi:hypothetical protein